MVSGFLVGICGNQHTKQNRTGSEHPNIAPYGDVITLRTGRQIVLAVGSDKQFAGLCEMLGSIELSEDLRFSSNSQRVRNRTDLMSELRKASEGIEDIEALMEDLLTQGVPAGVVRPLSEVFAEGTAGHNSLIEEGEIEGEEEDAEEEGEAAGEIPAGEDTSGAAEHAQLTEEATR